MRFVAVLLLALSRSSHLVSATKKNTDKVLMVSHRRTPIVPAVLVAGMRNSYIIQPDFVPVVVNAQCKEVYNSLFNRYAPSILIWRVEITLTL